MGEMRRHIHGGDVYRNTEVIDFSANINFRGMPQSVKDAAKQAVELCGNYPDTRCEALREALEKREGISKEHIICGNGAADLIFALVLAKKPKRALLVAPTFYEYEQALCSVDCVNEKHYLLEENGFELKEDFLDKITAQTDIVFLCNPNNPTGLLIERELLEKILKKCEKCDALLVLDECFNDFLECPQNYSMKDHVEKTKHLFLLKAFTKMYAMAGLRLGYGFCGNEELLEKMLFIRQPWSVSIPAQMAGEAAAKETEFAVESAKIIQKEKMKLQEEMRKKGYHVLDSQANYLFFKAPENFGESCMKKGIMVRDCSNYEGLQKGWYRVAVKSPEDNRKLLSIL